MDRPGRGLDRPWGVLVVWICARIPPVRLGSPSPPARQKRNSRRPWLAHGTITFGLNCTVAFTSAITVTSGTTDIEGNGFNVSFTGGGVTRFFTQSGGTLTLGELDAARRPCHRGIGCGGSGRE